MDWNSNQSHWFINPKLSQQENELAEKARSLAPQVPAAIWIRSSGTTSSGSTRWVCLSKKGFLLAARAANEHLQSQASDIWLRCLPEFHVGGLAILARSFLSGSKVLHLDSWSPDEFFNIVESQRVTLTSLVPTQVFDLVQKQLKCPSSLRAIVVGGDVLSPELYRQARELGWPVLPSYGLTEMGSQVATAPLSSLRASDEYPDLNLLSHVSARVNHEQKLVLQSEALLVGELIVESSGQVNWLAREPQSEFVTSDQVQLSGKSLLFLGRSEEAVKILGEWVSLKKLREIWQRLILESAVSPNGAVLLARPCARKGHEIVVAGEIRHLKVLRAAAARFNQLVEKYERLESLYAFDHLPQTELGKIKTEGLKKLIS